ncbi:MAG: GNAT family N-acetyltransferase [Bdellovibrionales bacterium]|nr:GNAT family N-acetyltransferase [Bdellovibrionales bacterium]
MSSFEFHLLDKSFDRALFDCGSDELNVFLKAKARQNQKANFNRTFVAIKLGDKKKRVLGFYSLSMGEIDLSSLPEELQRKLPKHPVPVARMGRLAVDQSTQGRGLGKLLLVDAMKRIQSASSSIGVYALLVDAKDDAAKAFYKKYGFIGLFDEPVTLFLPLASFPN